MENEDDGNYYDYGPGMRWSDPPTEEAGPPIQSDRSVIIQAMRDKITDEITEYVAEIAAGATQEEQSNLVREMINITAEIQKKMNSIEKKRKEISKKSQDIEDKAGFDRLMQINDQQTMQTMRDEGTFQAIHALLNRLGPGNENLKRDLLRSMVGTLQKTVFEHQDFRDIDPSLRGKFDDFTCALFEQISSSVRNIAVTSAAVVTEVSAPLSASAIMIISSVYMGTPKLVTAFALGYLGYQGGTILEQNGRLFQGWQLDCVTATATVLNGTCSIATGAVVGSANLLKGLVTRIAQAGGSAVYGISDIVTSAVNIYGTINDFECSPGSSPPSSQGYSPRSSNGSSRASNVSTIILQSKLVPPRTQAAQILNGVLAIEQGQVIDPVTGVELKDTMSSQDTDDSSDFEMEPGPNSKRVKGAIRDIDYGGRRRRGRKSRRYKKKRSTLKRRRLKRRRTRKGKKRRHTKKR